MIEHTILDLLDGAKPVKEWTGLSAVSSWIQPGNTGNTGGGSVAPHGKYTWSPGNPTTGQSGVLSIQPAAGWDNFYFYNTLVGRMDRPVSYFGYQVPFALPSQADVAACNAFEFELELCEAGLRYNMAWQWKPSHVDGAPAWRSFDKLNQKWVVEPSLPAPVAVAGRPVTLWAHFLIDRLAKTVTHDSVVLDGQFISIGRTRPAVQGSNPATWYLHNAVQMDPLGSGKGFTVQLGPGMTARAL